MSWWPFTYLMIRGNESRPTRNTPLGFQGPPFSMADTIDSHAHLSRWSVALRDCAIARLPPKQRMISPFVLLWFSHLGPAPPDRYPHTQRPVNLFSNLLGTAANLEISIDPGTGHDSATLGGSFGHRWAACRLQREGDWRSPAGVPCEQTTRGVFLRRR